MKYLVNTTCYCYDRARGSLQHPSVNLSWGNRINLDYIIGTGDVLTPSCSETSIIGLLTLSGGGGHTRGAAGPPQSSCSNLAHQSSLSSSGSPLRSALTDCSEAPTEASRASPGARWARPPPRVDTHPGPGCGGWSPGTCCRRFMKSSLYQTRSRSPGRSRQAREVDALAVLEGQKFCSSPPGR